MARDYGISVPQGWRMNLAGIADPVGAYEAMTRVAQETEALGFHSIWLYDHFNRGGGHYETDSSQRTKLEERRQTALIGTPAMIRQLLAAYVGCKKSSSGLLTQPSSHQSACLKASVCRCAHRVIRPPPCWAQDVPLSTAHAAHQKLELIFIFMIGFVASLPFVFFLMVL